MHMVVRDLHQALPLISNEHFHQLLVVHPHCHPPLPDLGHMHILSRHIHVPQILIT